jgi:hypothetical protein
MKNPAQRAQMGQLGQAVAAKRFSADVIVPKYEALYRRVMRITGETSLPDAECG